ncbi:60S ribosomal protein [Paramicrosporidium saccamoebae]|uniref:60S ribosomal protein n=1 Tax=Paramicrosporidium saccamoebae TaxID=1246581 RepID=A0A2H9THJ6_9FUNG|nr:60S ribosomal protein [Paramicrosporidium saccamoebae]
MAPQEKVYRVHQLAPCSRHEERKLGSNSVAKLVIIAANCPPLRRSEIEYYAMLGRTAVHHYTGNNIDLGTACGKYFRVGVLSITDAGDSDITQEMGITEA